MDKIGVIVGRFQVPGLTEGHKWLISEAHRNFDKVLILIGDTKILTTGYKRMDSHDPYPYNFRKSMILKEFPGAIIMRFEDVGYLPLWIQKLDNFLESMELGEYYMVGSRDSFVNTYTGKYGKYFLESPIKNVSGTITREEVFQDVNNTNFIPSPDFLKGVLWALREKERLENLNSDGRDK